MIRRAAFWLTLLAAAPVVAQDAAPAGDGAIVVTGKKAAPSRGEVMDQALDVSRVDPHALYEEALPRFQAPLCLGVFGLQHKYAIQVAARVRDNARRMGVRLAKADCSPNLLIAFMDDGRSFLAQFSREQPKVFAIIPGPERAELLDQASPVRVWTSIAKRWTGAGAPPRGWPDLRPSVWGQLSRSALPEANDIQSAVVVFDRAAVIGMTLTQLADYATMRGLSHTRPAKSDAPMATILGLFADEPQKPDELTRFDRGYLRSLYFEAGNQPAVSKLLSVRRRAAQER